MNYPLTLTNAGDEPGYYDVEQPPLKHGVAGFPEFRVAHPIFGYHTPEDARGYCQSCHQRWPCDGADAALEAYQLHAIARAARAVLDRWPGFAQKFIGLTPFGRAVARLESALDAYESWQGERPYRTR